MKKTLVFILISLAVIAFAMTSCGNNTPPPQQENKPLTKPFIIVGETISSTYVGCYTYQDYYGELTDFYDYIGKYNIGDTLK